MGAARGRPGGAPSAWVWGIRGRALSHPRLPALWAGCRGPLPTGCGCGGVRAWGPVTNPTARAFACWLCALWGRHKDARGGRLLPGCGASGVGRPPTPDCPTSGRAAGAHYPLAVGVGGCGRGDPSPTPQRAGFARCGGGMRVPGGGPSCLGVGRPGSGTLPPPTARPLGGLPGPTTHWLWVRGGAGVGTRHQPHSARPCELALRAVEAARGRPGGAPLAWVSGVRARAFSHPRLPALWACCRGQLRTGCGCGGVRAWGPVTNRTARWLCALWGRHEGARGGRLLPGCGASGVGRSPTPDCPPSGRAAGARYPLAVDAGGCGRGDPSPTPQRALLRAGFARCGGGTRVPRGGASCLGVGRLGSGALPPPTARPLGGLPGSTTHWLWVRGGAGVGTRHQPHSARSCELALRAVGAARGCPGGAPLAWVWGVRGRALSHPRLPALWAGCRGPLPTSCGCGGVRAWGHVTNPTARTLACWLCALWGRHEGAQGGRLLPGCGASGVGRSPTPDCPPSGRAAGAHYPLAVGVGGCGRGDPSPTPQSAGFARCGGGMRVPGGGASCLGVGRPGWGALPPPTARPLGGLPGPTTHWLWVWGGAGVGTRHEPHSALALRAVGAARGRPGGAPPAWVWGVRGRALSHPRLPALWAGCRGPLPTGCGCGGGAVLGTHHQRHSARSCVLWGRHVGVQGGRLLPGCGASGVGRSPTPDCPPSGRAVGAHYPLAVGAGGCGRGDLSPTPQRALLRAGFARCGGGTRVPGGGVSCLGVGRPGSGALPTPTACPLGGLPGPTTHWLWVWGGAGVGTCHQPHSARWLCALWGRHEGARGGRLLPGCGASGVGRSPTPDCPPSGRAVGARYPLTVGAGGCGRGDLSPTPQRALLRAGFARCGGGTRVPGGGVSCLGVGRPGSGALPPPTACPLGGLPGPTTHWLWVWGGAGVGTRHQPHSARWLCALWGRHEGARGGRLLPGCGASGVGRSPTPDCPPSGRAAGARYPLTVGAGGCGRGDPSPTPQRALLRAVGAACGCPGGAPLAWVWGVRGRVLSHPRLPALWAGCSGPLPTGCGCGGVRAWGPVTDPTARWLCALWGRH